jgi:hypothetical protein
MKHTQIIHKTQYIKTTRLNYQNYIHSNYSNIQCFYCIFTFQHINKWDFENMLKKIRNKNTANTTQKYMYRTPHHNKIRKNGMKYNNQRLMINIQIIHEKTSFSTN